MARRFWYVYKLYLSALTDLTGPYEDTYGMLNLILFWRQLMSSQITSPAAMLSSWDASIPAPSVWQLYMFRAAFSTASEADVAWLGSRKHTISAKTMALQKSPASCVSREHGQSWYYSSPRVCTCHISCRQGQSRSQRSIPSSFYKNDAQCGAAITFHYDQ